MDTIVKPGKTRLRDNYFLKAFFIGFGLSFLIFVPFMIIDGGYFLFYGDFNVQQIPFYQLAHNAIRSGNMGWNHYTDLGVNFIGSYSFYLLGSPFFWLTIPFPTDFLPYLMGPLFILKFSCATLSGYVYLHRYVKNQNFAIIGAVLYAFSGFSIYNIFFNHFHEAIIVFPLMLAALDEYMYKRRRGIFAVSVALCCVVNYYFFVGQVTFTLIYFFLRLICKSWKISVKDLLLLGLEAVMGFAISGAIMVPSVLAIVQNNRTDNWINGWNALIYNKNQRYMHILECFFFPPDLPARPNFTPDSESKWASLGAWLPLFGMTGVIGWLQIKRKHWLKKFLWILFLMAFVPFLNSSFQMMNSSYYARWFYMLTLMMSLATIISLEYNPVDWKRAITWTTIITAAIAAAIAFIPNISETDGEITDISFGLMQYPTRFWTYVAISLICIAIVVFIFQFARDSQKRFYRSSMAALSIVCVLYSVYFIAIGKTQSLAPSEHIIPYALNGGKDIDLPDLRSDSVRTDFYDSLDNSAMFWGVQSIQTFHSIVPGSIMDFYDSIGVKRDVASRPETEHYALRALTSVKWLFDDDHDDEYFAGEDNSDPKMPGWLYHSDENGFHIWENEYYIPMGFSYDYYISRTDYNALSEEERELVMLKALVIDDERIEEMRKLLIPLPVDQRVYTEEKYFEDCKQRAENTCDSFNYTNTGFTAEINAKNREMIFFSVPYEPGWSAKVGGVDVNIERVNVGFMAVEVPIGEQVTIEFTYHTPGLNIGIIITAGAVILLILYIQLTRKNRHAIPRKAATNRRKLTPKSFSSHYAESTGASFKKKDAMIPVQYKLPYPEDVAQDKIDEILESIKTDNETNYLAQSALEQSSLAQSSLLEQSSSAQSSLGEEPENDIDQT